MTPVKTLRDAMVVVMEALTSVLAEDPAGVAEGAAAANRAWDVGTVEHVVNLYGSWRTSVSVNGRPVVVEVRKRSWLPWRR